MADTKQRAITNEETVDNLLADRGRLDEFLNDCTEYAGYFRGNLVVQHALSTLVGLVIALRK